MEKCILINLLIATVCPGHKFCFCFFSSFMTFALSNELFCVFCSASALIPTCAKAPLVPINNANANNVFFIFLIVFCKKLFVYTSLIEFANIAILQITPTSKTFFLSKSCRFCRKSFPSLSFP